MKLFPGRWSPTSLSPCHTTQPLQHPRGVSRGIRLLGGLRAVRRYTTQLMWRERGGGVMLLLTAKPGCRPADRRSR